MDDVREGGSFQLVDRLSELLKSRDDLRRQDVFRGRGGKTRRESAYTVKHLDTSPISSGVSWMEEFHPMD